MYGVVSDETAWLARKVALQHRRADTRLRRMNRKPIGVASARRSPRTQAAGLDVSGLTLPMRVRLLVGQLAINSGKFM
jgi:hypothetical protein